MGKATVYARVLLALGGLGGCSDVSDDPGYGTQQLGEPVSESSGDPAPPESGLGESSDPVQPAGSDVPAIAQCQPVALWNASLTALETQVVSLLNGHRQAGSDCASKAFAPAAALKMAPALRCVARLHAKDMSDRDYFSHTAPNGAGLVQRLAGVSYAWRSIAENIGWGYPSASAMVEGWMKSDRHCQNIMNPGLTQVGVGLYGDSRWTLDLGTPK